MDNFIAVGASDGTDRLAGFSNYGLRGVDILAPGVGVRSTLPGGRYGEANGTSMATPHVSGSAALVWSLQPDATVPEIRRALLEQGDLIPAIGSQISTGRRLNANKSLSANVFAPTVQLVSAANITTAGGTEQLITVKYQIRLGVDKASLGKSDIVVTRQAALDKTLTTTLVSWTENANKTEVTAVYRLAAVGGTWDAEDYGNYSITANSDAARSLSGLASRETNIGSFQVKIAAAGIFCVDTLSDTVDTNPGDGVARDASGRTSLRCLLSRIGFRLHDTTPAKRWNIELSARIVDNQDRIATSLLETATTGFTTWDMRGVFRAPRVKGLVVATGVENMFDLRYREHFDFRTSSGLAVYQPGANFYISTSLSY